MLSKKFKSVKCKTALKLAISRIKLLKNKRDIQVKQLRRELAHLLETGQEQTAKIRVEHVIREEKMMSGYDLIEIYCELIVARIPIIESQKNCPIDLKEAISSVIFASPRCADIPELMDARKQFVAKYGKEFVTSALELRPDSGVNRMIVEKLSAKAPDTETKMKILSAIAKEHDVKWDSKAIEELLKPKEDLLNGSSSFISTSTMPVESLKVNFSSNTSQSKSASNIYQTDIPGKSTSFHSSSEANLRTTPLVPTPTQNESVESDGKTSTLEVKDSYPREETVSLRQPNWTMEFKDAASAAQEAAKSAERASIAARAAAELASRESISRQNSNDPNGSSFLSCRDERPKRSESSKLKGQISESINMKYDQVEGFQEMNEEEAHMLSTDESEEETSYHAGISDAGNARTFDGFRESFSRMEMENKKKHNDAESAENNVELSYGRSACAVYNGTFDDDSIWSPPTFDEHQASNHDNLARNIHEIDNGEKLFRDDTMEHDAPDYVSAVFDEYDPEPTEDKENLHDSFDKPFSFAPSNSSINSSIFSSSHHEIHPFTVEKVASSKFDDDMPVAFDDSDGLISESDDDISGSRSYETAQNITYPHEQRGADGDLNPRQELQPMRSTKAKSLPGTEEKNQLHASSSSVGADDPETPDEVADRGDFGLNFGRLTGGLRNRGYSHPPYTASSVVDSPVSSLQTSATSRTKQIISPQDFLIEKDPPIPIMPGASFILQSDKAKGSLSEEHNQGSRSNKAMSTDKSEEDNAGISVKQPVFNQEKSRRFREGNPIPSKHIPFDSTSNASEFLADSEVFNQKIYDEKPRTKVNKDLSSRMSKTEANTSSNTSFKLSRRTKDFMAKVQSNLPGSSEFSDMSTESWLARGSSAPELPSQIVDKATIIKAKQSRKLSKPNSSAESMSESSLHEDKKKNAEGISDPDTSSLSSGKNKSSDSGGGGTNLLETVSQKASHVHPKLPDYETFAAHFQSLRANPR